LSPNLSSVIDLGNHPLPSEYATDPKVRMEEFPLHMRICSDCGLGQLGEYVLPERIFHETYPYLSSASATWVEHSRKFAREKTDELNLGSNSYVLELASNDGYLLAEFKQLGIEVLGVEPAANVAKIALDAGIPTIIEFFGEVLANKILKEHGYPSLIVANNVYAHVPDLQDFTAGLSILAGPDTLISIENPSFMTLLENAYFDTIYHEHYSYHTAHSVSAVGKIHDLTLFKIDRLKTHGGSNRYWLRKLEKAEDSVSEVLKYEFNKGLFDPDVASSFAERSHTAVANFRKWILAKEESGDTVAAYGAAHKGNTFLNAVGQPSTLIKYVVDASHEKQGKFLPGSRIPVFAPEHLIKEPPTDVLILPWNISEELAGKIRSISPQSRIWVAQPNMREISLLA
jgi:hypothetical protein